MNLLRVVIYFKLYRKGLKVRTDLPVANSRGVHYCFQGGGISHEITFLQLRVNLSRPECQRINGTITQTTSPERKAVHVSSYNNYIDEKFLQLRVNLSKPHAVHVSSYNSYIDEKIFFFLVCFHATYKICGLYISLFCSKLSLHSSKFKEE